MDPTRPLRIVVYPHDMNIGGSQINAIELAAAVRDRGHHVSVFAAATGPLAKMVSDLGLSLAVAPPHHRRPSLTIARALRELCQRERVDVMHGYEWPPCLEAFYGPLLFDKVTVGCTVMSMSVAPFIPALVPLVVGTGQIAAAARRSRRGRVDVIEPPVDVRANSPKIDGGPFRRAHGLSDKPVVVLVSRLALELKLEGLERAVAAADLLADETGLRLVIVGDGPARARLEERAAAVNRRTGRPTVILTGELGDPRAAYAAADVALAMGGSALRAMAFAKPVIVLGERGFAQLLTPDSAPTFLWQGFYGLGDGTVDPVGLAEPLRLLLQDPQRRAALGQFALDLCEQRFSLEAAADRQLGLYDHWVRERPGRIIVAAAGASAAASLLAYKVRRRVDRLTSRAGSEDFNSVEKIQQTANAAGAPSAR